MKKRGIILVAILLVVTLAVNIACGSLNNMITSFMGANRQLQQHGAKRHAHRLPQHPLHPGQFLRRAGGG